MSIIQQLKSIGFYVFHTSRFGPCISCERITLTYFLPNERKWICEECYYHNPENIEFINTIVYMQNGINMTTNEQQILARLDQLEKENQALKAKATDNVFVGGTGNLTLKFRQANPRGWAVPTKNQNGQAYLRSGDFPMNYFVSQDGTKVILHQEIPVSPREIELFKQAFLMQNMVVAKRRQQVDANATASTPPATPTIQPTTSVSTSTQLPGSRKLSDLSAEEKQKLITEAKGLVESGLYTSQAEALTDVLAQHKISR